MFDVSIIVPVHNGEKWIEECLQSVVDQDFTGSIELSIYNDCSQDGTLSALEGWQDRLGRRNIHLTLGGHTTGGPRGVGFAKNRAVEQSTGVYLCFLDIDDVMSADRVSQQYMAATTRPINTLLGSGFHRLPEGSTDRYTKWANSLTPDQLYTQIYTSHGPTLIMPTWFCHRLVFTQVGGFSELGKGTPEDLLFFHTHLKHGGVLHRVDANLLMYRYHPEATTFSVHEDTIWGVRVSALEEGVLSKWPTFTIWNAGKQGRKLYRCLSEESRKKVTMFCDVDEKKIAKGVYIYEDSQERPKPRVPIVHFRDAKSPFVICVKQDLTGGMFEENLTSLNLTEGQDYIHFN